MGTAQNSSRLIVILVFLLVLGGCDFNDDKGTAESRKIPIYTEQPRTSIPTATRERALPTPSSNTPTIDVSTQTSKLAEMGAFWSFLTLVPAEEKTPIPNAAPSDEFNVIPHGNDRETPLPAISPSYSNSERAKNGSITETPLPADPLVSRYPDLTGIYSTSWNEYGGCILQVFHQISNGSFDEIELELYCSRGAPSYNMGYAITSTITDGRMAVYDSPSTFGECFIVFTFEEMKVTVDQIGGSCGFGHAVYANGVYQLNDNSKPRMGCLALDNPCN